MSVGPPGLYCITADQIESHEARSSCLCDSHADVQRDRVHPARRRNAAHGHARRSSSIFRKDSVPSFQAIASSSPICWMLFGSSRIFRILLSRSGGFPAAEGDLEIALPSSSLTKDRCTNAHQCRALGYSNWKILRHAHRKLRQRDIECLLQRIAQFSNPHKKFT